MKVTFIGLGAMGTAMVERLLQNKIDVTVYNRTLEKAIPLVSLGATKANSLQEAVAKADIIMTSLLDDQAVLAITDEMKKYWKENVIHVGLSTIQPDTAEKLLAIHQGASAYYVSGVVLGVPLVAREGNLTTFYAGNSTATDKVKSLLEIFSESLYLLGDESQIKTPNLVKICMNYSLMISIELMSELYIFAEKSGLSKETVSMILNKIYGHPAFQRYIKKIGDRDFDNINFTMLGGQKDAKIFKQAFSSAGVSSELCDLLNQRYQDAVLQGMQDKDWSGIYEVIREKSGLSG